MVWVNVFTIRIGISPIQITDYRYKLVILHGSTCWLGDAISPTIQLDKLSSLTRLTELRLGTIGGTWLRCLLLLVSHSCARWTRAQRLQYVGIRLDQWFAFGSSCGQCDLCINYDDNNLILVQNCLIFLICKNWAIGFGQYSELNYHWVDIPTNFMSWLVDYIS